MAVRTARPPPRTTVSLTMALLLGVGVALTIGVYAKVHQPAGRPLFLLGFTGMLQLKTWFSTVALLLVAVQVTTALWMWGRLPAVGRPPPWLPQLHRWSGSLAFVISLP